MDTFPGSKLLTDKNLQNSCGLAGTCVQHDPGACARALARTSAPVVLDLETTGLRRTNQIVSAGVLVDGNPFILFARSSHVSVSNLPPNVFRRALQPLERPDLVVVGHNLPFDLSFLRREGIRVAGEIRDTLKILRLLDQDRGSGRGAQARTQGRRDLRATGGPEALNYKLKPVVAQLLGIKMPHFPGSIEHASYAIHARYLACDLLGTKKLHDYLWPLLIDAGSVHYYQTLVAPLIPIFLDMAARGVAADREFVLAESDRLEKLTNRISDEHQQQHGIALGMDARQMCAYLFKQLGLPVLKTNQKGKFWVPSLDGDHIKRLRSYNDNPTIDRSLSAIQDYRQATSLLVRLRSLEEYIDSRTVRIYSTFDDKQATGRVSSSYPNLQQLARPRTIAGVDIHSRNALKPTPGYEFAVFDIAQADIRVLANMVESFERTTAEHLRALRQERRALLDAQIGRYRAQSDALRNPHFSGSSVPYPHFDPKMAADLAADFRDTSSDLYTTVVRRILGRAPVDKQERNRFKVIILSLVNGQGPPTLARALDCSVAEARKFLLDFERAYPKVDAFKWLMRWQTALTGQTCTFMGRPRTSTAQRWLVTEPRVEILVSFRHGDAYWLDIVPLEAGLRVLTSYVLNAWDARTGKKIYDEARGQLSSRHPKLFAAGDRLYLFPMRNWAWRSIRRVRVRGEEAFYEGFDKTARVAFNFICQGGTADVCKIMMLHSQPVCEKYGASLLIQIHDELVFEVPQERTLEFLREMKAVLEAPPVKDFKVPIIVEPKRGYRFGELVKVEGI